MRIYLDYAATTPLNSLVKKAMEPFFSLKFGNPSSFHFFGQEAIAAIDESREKIAKTIGADFREIIFTGSATEANNLALRGVVKQFKILNSKFKIVPRLVVSSIEHESILETCRDLEKNGVEAIYLPVNREGFVDLKKLKEALNERTVLVSVMCANNEIGTVQPIIKISKIIRDFRNSKLEARNSKQIPNSKFKIQNVSDFGFRISDLTTAYPLFHTDAVQAFQYLDCDVNKLGADLMTLSAHKIYGPKGIGALYLANKVQSLATSAEKSTLNPKPYTLNPVITGGGQEFGLRSGTENTPAIVGFAKAIELVSNSRELENKKIRELSGCFWGQIKKIYPKAEINGPAMRKMRKHANAAKNENLRRLPNILNIYFPGQSAENLLIKLDMAGVAASGGSACSTRSQKPSYVLKSCGLPENRIKSSLRFSLGRFTTKAEINEAIRRIRSVL